jgi:hypothetical protein
VRSVVSAFLLLTLLAIASPAFAQAALAATGVNAAELPPESILTLRPEPGLEVLAGKIARVLRLRSDTHVEVGDAPPPDLLEAVPAGHIAIAREADGIRLVLGGALGASFEARVEMSSDGELDPRAMALAVEALRDRAIEVRERQEEASNPYLPPLAAPGAVLGSPAVENVAGLARAAQEMQPDLSYRSQAGHDDGPEGAWPVEPSEPQPQKVEPRLYLRAYGGASAQSQAFRTGVGTAGGLCVQGQCVFLAVDFPLPIDLEAGGGDVRYRYPTFSCSFFSQPFHFGKFKPAASVGLLSRVGHFERDMGIVDYQHGLETDLGLRGTLEAAYSLFERVDLVAEAGLDYALDRLELGHGESVVYRGPRASPWLQAGVRIRPYW